jgi:MOSC domain-containing protein YiiM
MSSVVQILTAASPASPMAARAEVRAVPGCGLEGDRYFAGTGTFAKTPQQPAYELTLIEQEVIEAFARESGLPFTAAHARRNLVTSGIALNDLVGVEFAVGTVRLRGLELCEPCTYLAKTSFPEVLRGLVHRGGLRAQILTEGMLRPGDVIQCLTSSNTRVT